MQYLGIDWGTRRAAWCSLGSSGELSEGTISADEDGLTRLVARLGPDVHGCIEMMSGAVWVRDRLSECGWTIEIADAPAQPGAVDELAEHGVPEVWRTSLATLLSVIDDLDRRLAPLERELRPLARADDRARLLMSIPGVAELLGLTIAAEIGDISRFPSARKLVGYSGLTPRIKQSGQSSRVGRLSKAGPDTLRWAAVEASQQAWRPNNPWHELYTDIKRRHGKANPAKSAVARKVLIAAWHILSLGEPFKPSAPRATDPVPASSSIRLAA